MSSDRIFLATAGPDCYLDSTFGGGVWIWGAIIVDYEIRQERLYKLKERGNHGFLQT
jgi:hypothetical protein